MYINKDKTARNLLNSQSKLVKSVVRYYKKHGDFGKWKTDESLRVACVKHTTHVDNFLKLVAQTTVIDKPEQEENNDG